MNAITDMFIAQPVTIGDAQLYHGDCREIAQYLEVDAIVSDPPYGINFTYGASKCSSLYKKDKTGSDKIIGDDKAFDPKWMFDFLWNCNINNIYTEKKILLFGADHYKTRLPEGGQFFVWDKSCGQGPAVSFIDCEFMWGNRKNPRNIHRQLWKGVIREGEESRDRRVHVSQKPVSLMRWCLETMRIGLGKTVLDPYMGSGSTGVACVTSGRKFIGIEVDEKHFYTACDRIKKAQGL